MLQAATSRGGVLFELMLLGLAGGCGVSPIESLGLYSAADAGRVQSDLEDAGPASAADSGKYQASDAASPAAASAAQAGHPAAGSGSPALPVAPTPPAKLPKFERDDTAFSGLSEEVLTKLMKGDGPCEAGIAYPSAGTLFPGGLRPPTLMWPVAAGQTQLGAYLHVAYEGDNNVVDYQMATGAQGQLSIPRDAWREITARTNEKPLKLELKLAFTAGVQSCSTHIRVARGNITGSLFYYQSSLNLAETADLQNMPDGAQVGIYRLPLGEGEREPFITQNGSNCVGCHSMNARGTKLVSMTAVFNGDRLSVTDTYNAYDISSGKPERAAKVDNTNYSALTPDGKFLLSVGTPDCTAGETYDVPPNRGLWFVDGRAVARVQDTETGVPVEAHGLNPDFYMWMPQFSPDGRKVVFNHAKPDPARPGFVDRRELAVMDYDQATQTFSNLRVIVSHLGSEPELDYALSSHVLGLLRRGGKDGCSAPFGQSLASGHYAKGVCKDPCYPAWPSFTPDNRGVIFSLIDQPDFNHASGRNVAARSHLYYVELATKRVVRLDNAMRTADPEELGYDNYPSVLPVSSGGYAWVFWTGRRSFGTRGGGIWSPDAKGNKPAGAGNSSSRRIWVSGLRLPGVEPATELKDPSAPAFFLEGQGDRPSMRVFAALNACKADGSACESGIDCCAGFCTEGECALPPQRTCSKVREACETSADCCQTGTGQACIGGYCDVVVLE